MSWILTRSGKHFDLINPQPEMVNAIDIAHALSHICRFSGHCDEFYSVAQHSVLVSRIVPPELAFEALLHDAAEAYISDITRPLKHLLPDYRAIEYRVDCAIRAAFDLPYEPSPAVKTADITLLATERRDLMPDDDTTWPVLNNVLPLFERIVPLNPKDAKGLFLERLVEILQS